MISLPDPCDTRFLERALRERKTALRERRQYERRSILSAARLVPVTLDGPDFSRSQVGWTEDVSRGGAALLLTQPPLGPRWAVALGSKDAPVVMEVTIRDLRRTKDGRFRVACQFVRRCARVGAS